MPQIIVGNGGVNRKVAQLTVGVGGVNRKVKEAWAGVAGVNRKVFASGKEIGTLPIGSIVKLNYKIKPSAPEQSEFLVVHKGLPSSMYDNSCNGTWLLLNKVDQVNMWSYGGDNYATCLTHQDLNDEYLNLFDAATKNVIKQVKIPYCPSSASNATVLTGANGLSCKLFCPAAYEVGLTTAYYASIPRDGAVLKYFEGADDISRYAHNSGGYTKDWHLRSPNLLGVQTVWYITSGGRCLSRSCNANSISVRFALILPSDQFISDTPDSSGAYTLKF